MQLGLEASTAGVVGVPGGDATEDPSVLPDPDPADPPPEHSVAVSGTQVKPGPQSEATWQGRSYLGTHDIEVVVVHPPASTDAAGAPQSSSAAHLGSATAPGQLTAESAKQTIPVAQSESVVQGPGSQSLITTGSQTGCVHADPDAQAMAGQAVAPTVWQVKPWVQSLSCVQVVTLWARAALDAPSTPSAASPAKAKREEKRAEARTDRVEIMGSSLAVTTSFARRPGAR